MVSRSYAVYAAYVAQTKKLLPVERELRRRLAASIIRLRVEKGWSQEEAADRAGLHDKHLQKIEYGTVNVTFNTVAKLAAAFGVKIEEFLKS